MELLRKQLTAFFFSRSFSRFVVVQMAQNPLKQSYSDKGIISSSLLTVTSSTKSYPVAQILCHRHQTKFDCGNISASKHKIIVIWDLNYRSGFFRASPCSRFCNENYSKPFLLSKFLCRAFWDFLPVLVHTITFS